MELVQGLDDALAALVRVADRVRARLGERELQVAEHVLRERTHAREAGEGEPAQRDVFRLRRNRQPDRMAPAVAVPCLPAQTASSLPSEFER